MLCGVCPVVTLFLLLTALCACTVLGRYAVRCMFFVMGRLFRCARDALRQTCFVLLLFSLLLTQCAGAVLGRYVVRCIPSAVCRLFRHAAKLLRCISLSAVADAMRSVGARWKGSVLWNRNERFASLQCTTPLQQPSAPRSGSGRRRTMFSLFRTCSFAK